jgi:hypothetical protein
VLDGSLSYDPDGTIISYEWYDGGTLIGSGATRYVIYSRESIILF